MILIINDLLDAESIAKVRELVISAGFQDGRTVSGSYSRKVKHNEIAKPDDPAVAQAGEQVVDALARQPDVAAELLPRHIRRPIFNIYRKGMYIGDHTDNALMPGNPVVRTDFSMTLFLCDPDSYSGGELVINCDSPEAREIKLPSGAAVFYPAGTLHRVNEVTDGERLVAITWIQSLVRDSQQREVLAELGRISNALTGINDGESHALRLQKTRSNLLRMWADI